MINFLWHLLIYAGLGLVIVAVYVATFIYFSDKDMSDYD